MKKGLSLLLFLGYYTLNQGIFLTSATAQVIPDGTTATTVDIDGTINDGNRASGNLFHSFREFSVPEGGRAFFNNAADIVNIFSRVTGGNISNINGLLGANGTANLFLINPAGIIFGENARLDIGGSFFGSTADSFLFTDGTEFSALDGQNQPILTINAPIGLNFRDNPGDIVNRSVVQNSAAEVVGLEVNPGETLALIGGNIDFEAGSATGGSIKLGGLLEEGTVTFNDNGTLNFSENVARADITLSDGAQVSTSTLGEGDGGNVTIDTASLSLSDGAFISASTSGKGKAGDLTITASESVSLSGEDSNGFASSIGAQVDSEATGDGGNVTIDTASLSLNDGAFISASNFGKGKAGDLTITASESVSLSGQDSQGFDSSIDNRVSSEATGDGGNITIDTTSLSLSDGAQVSTSTFGQGNAGDLKITASESIELVGQSERGRTGLFSNAIEGSGNGGNLIVNTDELTVKDGATINVGNFQSLGLSEPGTGQAGNLIINAGSIRLDNNGAITADTVMGKGGNITLQINDIITLDNDGLISAAATGDANGGNINVQAQFVVAFPSQPDGSDIVASAPQGRGGNITISSESVINLEEREAIENNGTNDIDVTGLVNGLVTIINPNVDITQELLEAPQNVVKSELAIGQICQNNNAKKPSVLNIKGKGGIPLQPLEPFMADLLIPDGKPITVDKKTDLTSLLVEEVETEQADPYYIPPHIKPIKTSMGDIYPARGIIKTEDGKIILTAYPTDNVNSRTPHKSANCNPS